MKVIVTGASKGIGRGIASYLAMDGFEVGLLARSEDLLEDLRQSLEEEGSKTYSVACDLRDPDQSSYAIGALIDQMNGIDALINNAGVVTRKNVFDISLEEWQTMIDTNINGVFHATRTVLPYMREQESGHIVNISSISGKVPLPGGSGYAATKYAVTGFSQSLFQELRDYNIKVTTIFPGSVDSASHRHNPDEDVSWKVSPEEIGQACAQALRTASGTCIQEIEIRPLRRPPKT